MKKVEHEKAMFAGGCFWCTESVFIGHRGVINVRSGYTGGHTEDPSYQEVSSGQTGHYESVEVVFDPHEISFNDLLDIYWKSINPLDAGGQFADRGSPYFTAIFYTSEEQHKIATASLHKVSQQLNAEIATKILPAGPFYPAEEYHQHYSEKNPFHYQLYKEASGRQEFLKKLWKK